MEFNQCIKGKTKKNRQAQKKQEENKKGKDCEFEGKNFGKIFNR